MTSTQDLGVPKSGIITLNKKVGQITESNYIDFSVILSSINSSNGISNTREWSPSNLPISVKHISPGFTAVIIPTEKLDLIIIFLRPIRALMF